MASFRARTAPEVTSKSAYGKTLNTTSSANIVSSPLNQSKALNLESVPIIKDSVFHSKPMRSDKEVNDNDKSDKNWCDDKNDDKNRYNDKTDKNRHVPTVYLTPPSSPIPCNSKHKSNANKGELTKRAFSNNTAKRQPDSIPLQSRSKSLDHQTNDSLDLNDVEVIDDVSINRWLMRIMRLGTSYTSTGSNGYHNTSTGNAPSSLNPVLASPSSSISSHSSFYTSPPAFGTVGALMSSSYLHQTGRRRMSLNVVDQNHLLRMPTATGWRVRRLSDSSSIASGHNSGAGVPIPHVNLGSSLGSSSGYMSSPASSVRANRLRRGI